MGMFKPVRNLGKGSASVVELLSKYVFGNTNNSIPEEFDPEVIYQKGELILKEMDGKIIIMQAIVDQTTPGEFVESEWSSGSVSENTTAFAKGIVVLSKAKPKYENNQLWVIPIETREQYVIDYEEGIPSDISQVALVFEEEDYPVSEPGDMTNTKTPLFFDPEGEKTVVTTELDGVYELVLDEGDVFVSADTPEEDGGTRLWIDTDITDG